MKDKYEYRDVFTNYLPLAINHDSIGRALDVAGERGTSYPILAIVTGTKPDFYKQAPLVLEAMKRQIPSFVIDTGQHFDDTLGYGIQEFNIQGSVACNLQVRGNLMEKASELLLKFAIFGKIFKEKFPGHTLLPVVHGDTLVAGITPLSWLFGLGQKVAQNEAGLRSMSPKFVRNLSQSEPDRIQVDNFVSSQFDRKSWFVARDEPFPEQVDTWICSAGTQFFFAPTLLNQENLIREGYPEELIYVVGNSVVDAIEMKRRSKPQSSIFNLYPELVSELPSTQPSSGGSTTTTTTARKEWIRVDIHRRENLTPSRFSVIVKSLIELVKAGYRVVLIKLTATQHALDKYGLTDTLDTLQREYPRSFVQTPLWKEYGHVIEFLDSGRCWLELTDSGSMQEELLYFPGVNSVTVRLNTDRPETIFEAQGNVLAPPVNSKWIVEIVRLVDNDKIPLYSNNRKKKIYGEPGQVSPKVMNIVKKHFDENYNFYPWLHNRLGLWKEQDPDFTYL
jgi:UDP-N-acetylglucosamine 2-epimerase